MDIILLLFSLLFYAIIYNYNKVDIAPTVLGYVAVSRSSSAVPRNWNICRNNKFTMQKRNNWWINPDFAEELRSSQKNDSFALVNDIIVIEESSKCTVYVILNNANTKGKRRFNSKMSVSLFLAGKNYRNLLEPPVENMLRFLKYEVEDCNSSRTVSLFDQSTNYQYSNLPYKIIKVSPKKRRVAICVFISGYNSIAQIKHWIAFYMIQQVDNLIVYSAQPIEKYTKEFRKSIETGFLIIYHFPWPLDESHGRYQYTTQLSHINSCYYRHRGSYEYIISLDVDEYMYSERYPCNLYYGIKHAFALFPGADALQISSYLYHGEGNQVESLQKGTLFDDYTIRLNNRFSGRPKEVISTKGEGWYSIYWCYDCNMAKNIPVDILHIAHFSNETISYGESVEYNNLKNYTQTMKEAIKYI